MQVTVPFSVVVVCSDDVERSFNFWSLIGVCGFERKKLLNHLYGRDCDCDVCTGGDRGIDRV